MLCVLQIVNEYLQRNTWVLLSSKIRFHIQNASSGILCPTDKEDLHKTQEW